MSASSQHSSFDTEHAVARLEQIARHVNLNGDYPATSDELVEIANGVRGLVEQLETAQAALCEIAESQADELNGRPSHQRNNVVTITPYEWARSRAAAALYPACEHDWVTQHPGGPSDDFCRKCHVNRRAWRAASSPASEPEAS